jgi:hypothetical protein
MNKLIDQVTPLTRGIIWLVNERPEVSNPHYGELDYLLDGLLTANLANTENFTSQVIIGNNYNSPLYVMIIKEINAREVESYVSLLEKDLITENDFIVIDESKNFEKLKPHIKKISSRIKSV